MIDGSLFPTLIQISPSDYRKRKNAFKLQLAESYFRLMTNGFELSRLEIIISDADRCATRVVFQVFEANLEWIALVKSFGKRSRNPVLFIDDIGIAALEMPAAKRAENEEKTEKRWRKMKRIRQNGSKRSAKYFMKVGKSARNGY